MEYSMDMLKELSIGHLPLTDDSLTPVVISTT
jgi:hypothetical protein